jgi:hypothetical protein
MIVLTDTLNDQFIKIAGRKTSKQTPLIDTMHIAPQERIVSASVELLEKAYLKDDVVSVSFLLCNFKFPRTEHGK